VVNPPSAPAGIFTTVTGSSVTVTLSASASDNGSAITGYYVQFQRSVDGSTNWSDWSSPVNVPLLSYTYNGLSNAYYKFRAYSVNAGGNSPYVTTTSALQINVTTISVPVPAVFDANPIYSGPFGVQQVRIKWHKPLGSWDYLMLVRSTLGFPVTPEDGTSLLTVTPAQHDNLQFPLIDPYIKPNDNSLAENQVYYYSVFVKGTGSTAWTRAATTMAMSVKSYGTTQSMYDKLPVAYKASTYNTGLVDVTETNSDLVNFLSIFASEYDSFKASAENVKNRYDIANLDGRLVPLMMHQFGLNYEAELGLAQGRRLIKSFAKNLSMKGTTSGLASFVTAFSGYNCSIGTPVNLMLNTNDSSAENSIGSWAAYSNDNSLSVALPATVTPYAATPTATNVANSQNGSLKVTVNNVTSIDIRCGYSAPITAGVPVKSGTTYTFSAYSKAATTTRSIVLKINWFNYLGTLISTTTGTGVTNSAGTWVSVSVTGAAPTGAVFAVPAISTATAALNEVHYFDGMQFQVGASVLPFADARRVDITLLPNRTNLLLNPQFVGNVTTNWAADDGISLSAPTVSWSVSKMEVLSGPAIGTSDVRVAYQNVAISANKQYSFSAQISSPITPAADAFDSAGSPKVQAYVAITWYDSSNTALSTIKSATVVPIWYGDLTQYAINSVSGTAPATAVTANATVYVTSTGNAAISGVHPELYISKPVFELSSNALPYFDGDLNSIDLTTISTSASLLLPIPIQASSGTGVVTLSTGFTHGILPYQTVTISGVTPIGYNGTWEAQPGTSGSSLVLDVSSVYGAKNPAPAITAAGKVSVASSYLSSNVSIADVSWDSTDHVNSMSYFYLNKSKVIQRLKAVIPDALPMGALWAIFYK